MLFKWTDDILIHSINVFTYDCLSMQQHGCPLLAYLVRTERYVADGRKVDFPFDDLEKLTLTRPLFRLLSADEVDELGRQDQVPLA